MQNQPWNKFNINDSSNVGINNLYTPGVNPIKQICPKLHQT